MPNYRRLRQPGGSWFFTVNIADRRQPTLVDEIAGLMRAVRHVKHRRPFRIDALVVLPDHLHAIWTLPEGDSDFATRWRLIKTHFVKSLPATERLTSVQLRRGERGVWQQRYWEHLIRDDHDYRAHVDYCYFNPVKHGLVERVFQWPHSTYHRDVRAGLFARDFDYDRDAIGVFGERPLP